MPPSLPSLGVPLRAALVACVLALVPAAAASATPAPGLNVGGPLPQADLDTALSSGAKSLRYFVSWTDVQPSGPNAWNTTMVQQYQANVAQAAQRGARVMFVLTGAPAWAGGGPTTAPSNADAYAAFAGGFASRMRAAAGRAGVVMGYEVWNEPDAGEFWTGGPEPARYAALLKATAPKLRDADPSAKVVLGPMTGNNYGWLEQLYGLGVKGSFDAAAVHTDTACLDRGPDRYYRDGDRLARFTFLSYREVHATMAAHGDGDKPIWMTELGWSANPLVCARGTWAGTKPAGVSEAAQAEYLRQAFHCMAADPYVEHALWFTYRDHGAAETELNRYGLLRFDGSRRPSWDAFRSLATQGDTYAGSCGDFGGPSVRVHEPTAGLRYVEYLPIAVSGSDPSGIQRLTVQGDGRNLRHFRAQDGLTNGRVMRMVWYGAKDLAYGPHTITLVGKDPSGNTVSTSVKVVHVRKGGLRKSLRSRVAADVTPIGRTATLSARVTGLGPIRVGGRARIVWQWRSPAGWRSLHSGSKNAGAPFVVRQRLARAGTWRVRVVYLSEAPYRSSASPWRTFVVG